jgi:hypothetical protein
VYRRRVLNSDSGAREAGHPTQPTLAMRFAGGFPQRVRADWLPFPFPRVDKAKERGLTSLAAGFLRLGRAFQAESIHFASQRDVAETRDNSLRERVGT